MVAIITGNGTGLERSSAWVLGSRGQLGSAALGRAPEDVYVNAATGNLLIARKDEFLIGKGPDSSIGRAYNSQGNLSDDNGDNWKATPTKNIWASGGVNVAGAIVTRRDWDGSETVFNYDVALGKYVSREGDGAYDTIVYNGEWHWIDGDSRIDEFYSAAEGYHIKTRTDQDDNKLTYTYTAGKLVNVATQSGESTQFVYSGNNLTELVTYASGTSTRVRYGYDASNRLSTVTVDLSQADNSIADGNTYVTSYTYDGTSTRIATISEQSAQLVQFTYALIDGVYKVASQTQTVAAGVTRTTLYDYSVPGRTIVTDPAGQKTILFYNASKELTQISYPADNTNTTPTVVQFAYNANGDVISAALGPGNVVTYEYDANGNLTRERDSAGNTIARTWSAKNELLTETRYLVPDPDGAGASQPTAPVTTRYAYDAEGHLRYMVSAEGFVTQYEYDAAGQRTAANEYAGNAYSLAGLAENVSIAESTLTTWVTGLDKTTARRTETVYDFRGNVQKVTSWSRLLSNGLFDTGSERSETNYVYDQFGNLLSRQATGASASEVFTYDGIGRQLTATDLAGGVTRTTFLDTLGQTVVTLANGLSEVSTYNRAGELIAFSKSTAGGNLVNLVGWPSNPGNVPSGQATVAGWANYSAFTDETQWASTMGPDGLPVVAIRAGQLDTSEEGGGNYTHEITIDASKAYEFTWQFKLSAMDNHYVFFGLSGAAPAYVENLHDGVDNGNPYFWYAYPGMQDAYLDPDKWYKVVGYVLPQGTPTSSAPLGGVYDVATGQKVLDLYLNFRWNPERPGNTVHSRFFDYYGTNYQNYSTYFLAPEVRQVSTATVLGPDAATSLYRYDNLGRLRMTIDPTGRRNYMMYDSVGRKVADIDSDGSVIEYRYDGNSNLTSTTRYVNKLNAGQIASLVDGNGNPTSAGFASLRPAAHADDQWTFQVYDNAQRLVQTIDGTGATTVLSYDGASRVTSTRRHANKLSGSVLTSLKAEATNPNLWANPNDGTLWPFGNLTRTATGATIDGAPSYQFSVINGGQWEAFASSGNALVAGDTASFTISIKAVGATTTEVLGIYGYTSGWGGPNSPSTAAIVSGPGTMTAIYGGIWTVSGLSTTEATRVTITRRMEQAETAEAYFYLKTTDFSQVAAGTSVIAAAPIYLRSRGSAVHLPTADANNDRTTRHFHDNDGRVIATLDALGGLTQFFYDKGGRKIRELASMGVPTQSLWASGTLAQLIASAGTSGNDRRNDQVYDARGFLRYTVEANGHVTKVQTDAAGRVNRTVTYAGLINTAASYTVAYIDAQATALGLTTDPLKRISRSIYDDAGRLAFSIDSIGAVSAYVYDSVGNVIKQTRYATLYTTTEDPTVAAMQGWAAGQAGVSANRISRNVYDVRGNLAYAVDAAGYVTENQYDKAGRVTRSIRYAGAYTVSDGVTRESLAAQIGAPSGAAVTLFSYDADGLLMDTTVAYGTPEATTTRLTYDSFGQVIDTIAGYGSADASTTRRAYNVLGQVVSETAAYGTAAATTMSYAYDALGNRISVTDPRGSVSYSFYDAVGRLWLQVDAEGYGTKAVFNPFGQAVTVTRYWQKPTGVPTAPNIVTDAKDATTVFTYDNLGRLTHVTDAENFQDSYGYNHFGERTTVTNKLGLVTSYAFDNGGRLIYDSTPIAASRPDGTTHSNPIVNTYGYDSWGARNATVEWANGDQRTTVHVFDKLGRVIQTTHNQVTVTNPDFTTSTVTPTEYFDYDSRGNLILATDAVGRKVFAWYDLVGRKTHEVAATHDESGTHKGTLSRWTYDARGNVKTFRIYNDSVTVPAAAGAAVPSAPATYRETTFAHDAADRMLTSTVANLRTGSFDGTYYTSTTGNVFSETVHHFAKGVAREIDANGNSTWTWFDRLGHKIARVDKENYLTVWTRDTNGNAGAEYRYVGKITGAFDQNSSVAALQTLAGTSANDRTTVFGYDRNGRRTSESRLGVASASVSGTGALSTATQNSTIYYEYNGLGLVKKKTEATGEVTDYGYDNAGRLIWVKDPTIVDNSGANVRRMTESFYDGIGNVVRIEINKEGGSAGDDRVTKFTYAAGGRLSSIEDAVGFVRSLGYDAAGRVVKETYVRQKSDLSTIEEGTLSRYDLAGRLVIQSAATKVSGTWTFGIATRLRYNAHGEVTGRGLTGTPAASAVYQEVMDHDEVGRIWRSTAGDGSTRLFLYDKVGNQTLAFTSTGNDLSAVSYGGLHGWVGATGGSLLSSAVTTVFRFDKRGQQLEQVEPDRQLSWNGSSFATATVRTSRTYNAFGEVATEIDARGAATGNPTAFTTSFSYNTMGRLVQKISPSVSWTSESGAVASASPVENYLQDISGRMVAVQDVNGNYTKRNLLAGTGYGGEEAMVIAEFHADSGVARTYYDAFRDARVLRDELSSDQILGYDKMGQVVSLAHRGGLLTDYFTYDGLGRRIRHYNSQLGSGAVERTDYDVLGRVTFQTDFSGSGTSQSYVWDAGIGTSGMATFGGWTKTTTVSGQSSSENTDYFGRVTYRISFGSLGFSYGYDWGGRMTSMANAASGISLTNSWLNTGRLYQLVDAAGSGKNTITARYGYDVAGNRTYEGYSGTVYSFYHPSGTTSATQTLQNATIAYDALNRVTSFTDKDAGGTTRITITNEYDLAGNLRRTSSVFPNLANPQLGNVTRDKWYRYDSMNRTVTADGVLSGGAIIRGSQGVDVAYDVAGRRRTQTRDAMLTGIASQWVEDGPPQYEEPLEVGGGEPGPGHYEPVLFGYEGIRREEYEYRADGALSTVKFAETGYVDNMDGTVSSTGVIGTAQLRAQFDRDAMGRIDRYREWDIWSLARDRTVTYDLQNHITYEHVSQRKSTGFGLNMQHNTYVTNTTNSYVNGLLISTTNDEWKNGVDEGANGVPDSLTTYSYSWWDGAQISSTTFDGDTSTGANSIGVSTYYYDGLGRVASVDINDGRRRSVSFAYTPEGQTLLRKERSAASTNPEDQRLFLSGMQVGELTNNGNYDPAFEDYATNIHTVRNLTAAQTAAPFRWNTTAGVTRGMFGTSAGYDYINPEGDGANSTGGSYIVRSGDTLQSIAASTWGDASLWYMIASANGLNGSEQLTAGQSLILPDRVTNIHNNASTFEVYDPNRALGDLNPTTPTAPKATKKGNKCGIIGQILMVAIAVAVSVVTAGAALAALAPAAAGITSIGAGITALVTGATAAGAALGTAVGVGTLAAAGAIGGAVGSIASQAFGVATGIQDKFSWKGVAMSALSGAIGAGLGASASISRIASPFVQGAVRGALGSALSQGIGVATGLQDKFDWVGVAAAGVGGGVSSAVGSGLGDMNRHVAGLISSGVGAMASAATRSLITGTSFGDNVLAALPDVIGSTLGNMIAEGMAGPPRLAQTEVTASEVVETAQTATGAAPATPVVLTDAQRRQLVIAAKPEAIASIELALQNPSLDAAERADLQVALATLRGRDITYRYGPMPNRSNAAASAGMENGRASIRINIRAASLFNADGTVNVSDLARSLIHEARHIYDNRAFRLRNGPTTLEQVRRTERNASRTEAAYLKGAGLTGYTQDPTGAVVPFTSATANYNAELSVKSWVDASRISAATTNATIDRNYAIYLRQVTAYNARNGTNIRPTPRQRHIVPPVYTPPSSY